MSEAFIHKLTAVIKDPELRPLLSILKGFRNGFVCGAKIRFPHALVMTLLFSNKSAKENAKLVFHTTKTHALNLAFFVTIYKIAMLVLSRLNEGKESSSHSLISGFLGGYFVFGKEKCCQQTDCSLCSCSSYYGIGKPSSKARADT
ncbi:hypothetical protein DSO57_1015545 [Entomophthora muscae]|uniref:Uncharacterized protein n=1 Tax=Entomophthora muscae TaxID=34485 RepID=A0ACC2S750_9FUNG|nr:hypothetical protein DSO57_1015545 [Entomophthora muscae]